MPKTVTSNVFDSTFYGLGKTNYMLFESVVTNSIYYGTAFILYLCGVWQPTLIGIALLFGIGNAFDGIVSLVAYAFLLKKKKIKRMKMLLANIWYIIRKCWEINGDWKMEPIQEIR